MRTLRTTIAYKLAVAATLLVFAAAAAAQTPIPIIDSHIHYSHDAREQLPPEKAVA